MRNRLVVAAGALAVISGLLLVCAPRSASKSAITPSESQRTSAALFAKHCATCHGKDGRSKTFKAKFNHARNLTEPGWQEAVSDERIFNSIANGRGGKMPSFAKKLSVAEIEGLVLFVRGLKTT